MSPDHIHYRNRGPFHSYEKAPREVGSYSHVVDIFLKAVKTLHGSSKTILDVGAGTGLVSEYMNNQGFNVTALDPSITAMRSTQARKIYSTLDCADISDKSIDGIHIKDCLEHIQDKEKFFSHCGRILSSNGIIMCTFTPVSHATALTDKKMGNPRYFATTYIGIAKYLEQMDIQVQGAGRWKPEDSESDWYQIHTNRVVIIGVKRKTK